ncbi:MAG: DNA mismatch repair protein MutS [Clostridiales bacterium]|jgi:DNA mismatch repair protein MutS|nr:DNA mismatch repair protein MutS [Clostridiales bacterium]
MSSGKKESEKVHVQHLTPMFQQYYEIKSQVEDCILFYRLGDFYEMFFEDAILVSRELDLTLTGRECGLEKRAPMCGVPLIAHESYLSILVQKGFKVAICEQTSPPGKGLVRREITKIITKGTAIDPGMIGADSTNYLCCVYYDDDDTDSDSDFSKEQESYCLKKYGVSWTDLSTGQFNFQVCEDVQKLQDLLSVMRPKEVICNEAVYSDSFDFFVVTSGDCPKFSKYYEWAFEINAAIKISKENLDKNIFDKIKNNKCSLCAIGALLSYIRQNNKSFMAKILDIEQHAHEEYVTISHYTRRTLEISHNMKDNGKTGTLCSVLNTANTDMGKRLLNSWITQPLVDSDKINLRLDAVEILFNSLQIRDGILKELKNLYDIERLSMRILHKNVRPQDLLNLSKSLHSIPKILTLLKDLNQPSNNPLTLKTSVSKSLQYLQAHLESHSEFCELIDKSIDVNASLRIQDGNVIANGYSRKLDDLRQIKKDGTSIIASIEIKERESTGFKKLKITYNKVSGYCIELPKSHTAVPYYYKRKQTMSNVERYSFKELKEVEKEILNAQDNIIKIEAELYAKLTENLEKHVKPILKTATLLAELDCFVTMANFAAKFNYVRPIVDKNLRRIDIVEGRHPVVENLLGSFVPNDTFLNSDNRTMIISGPNMSGKSVYMRQVALIAMMAQCGFFVPCKKCELSPVKGIFARIGSGDDMMSSRSTFMVEMSEVAHILNNLTESNLVLLDELGRGTATYDGISIAKAVIEHLVHYTKCYTMFSTHYHELTELENLPSTHNFHMQVNEIGESIIFLNKLIKGSSNKSFGVHVAAMSGLPDSVIKRAKELLDTLHVS